MRSQKVTIVDGPQWASHRIVDAAEVSKASSSLLSFPISISSNLSRACPPEDMFHVVITALRSKVRDLMTRIIISSVPGTVWIYFLTSHNPRGRHSPCPLHTPERSGGLPKVTHPNRVGRKLPVLGSEPNLFP